AVMDKGVHLLGFFGRQVLGDVKIVDFTRDLRIEPGGIKACDAVNAGTAVDDIIPGQRYCISDRGHNSQSGDDNASFHGWLLPYTEVNMNQNPEIKKGPGKGLYRLNPGDET